MIRNCAVCEIEYDDRSPQKRAAGGLIIHCHECSEETEIKVLGVSAGDGKQSSIDILRFASEEDRKTYKHFWKNNSGYNKGKSCQLGRHLSSTPDIRFEKVAENRGNANHKGKA